MKSGTEEQKEKLMKELQYKSQNFRSMTIQQ